ncbi:MAG: hydrogenase formation protein HypD [Candidatus Omnitrophota bacterium]
MRYIDEFRDRVLIEKILSKINELSLDKGICLMEVCGTHTMSIHRHGLPALLPKYIKLISGPGCPVCVTTNDYIDRAIAYSKLDDCIVVTFGDMLKVPGSNSNLQFVKADGAHVEVVYSAIDAVELAQGNPNRKVIFLGIGFETTAPTIAASILEAKKRNIKNYFVLSTAKTMPLALKALAEDTEIKINGFILPGHVSAIIGSRTYEFIPKRYKIACVIAGFEPLSILDGIYMLALQIKENIQKVQIQYRWVVKPDGNPKAQEVMYEVFEPCDCEWRGLGLIEGSGLRIRDEYKAFDAEANISVETARPIEQKGCICGEVIKGKRTPTDCALFGKSCNPESPYGPCMVSSEGACSAYYKYGGKDWS